MRRVLTILAVLVLALALGATGVAEDVPIPAADAPVPESEVALGPPADEANAIDMVPVSAARFPDKRFRARVLADFDLNGDGALSKRERDAVALIDVSGSGISSLKGIEVFGNLKRLYFSDNRVSALDLSGNPQLVELYGASNRLKALNLGGKAALKVAVLEGNCLESVSLRGCGRLARLDVSDNALIGIDVSGCGALRELDVSRNRLTQLNVSKNGKLTALDCSGNQIKKLDIRACRGLETLSCADNRLSALAVKGFKRLKRLDCAGNRLQALDAGGCKRLRALDCRNNGITALSVAGDWRLESLDCRGNQLRKLEVRKCAALSVLRCGKNEIGLFDISALPARLYKVVSVSSKRMENKSRDEIIWHDGKGIEVSFARGITLSDGAKLAYGGENIFNNLKYLRSGRREDYPDLSDAAFANFREVRTTGMGRNVLYRGSSPLRTAMGRNRQAAAAMKAAGIRTVLNLSDDRSFMVSLDTYRGSYYSRQNVMAQKLASSSATAGNLRHYVPFFRYMIEHEGPYLSHCELGRDRTGTFCAVLECLMGASGKEVVADYMETYTNFYRIRRGSGAYNHILNVRIRAQLKKAMGLDVTTADGATLSAAATDLLLRAGMTEEEIEALKGRLGEKRH